MDDLKKIFKENYLRYASYVILDRAIPDIVDGLKPVQRRILWTLFQMDDGKLHKVANVAGQTMALHPHGDGPITDALINLANKGYLIDCQGNFGNPLTGDPAAASRYIEARLGALAKETLFNPQLTPFIPSYDGRANEPVTLPAKIPLLLMLGSEGIAVGMSTRILPHNFKELVEAEIAILEQKPFKVLPDFPSGGIMDSSEYAKGQGRVKLRAKIDVVDEKTLVIREICFGTTTESLIRSIDEAAKKGKIKIDAINDYTAEKVEIEIKLPRGHYAKNLLDALYAFTECEVSLNSQITVIQNDKPIETTVDAALKDHSERLVGYLKTELELEKAQLLEKIFEKTLEQIFIENRLYKQIENVPSLDKIHSTIETSLKPFQGQLSRIPNEKDREKLLSIPIRRISRFDIDRNQKEIEAILKRLEEIEKNLKNIRKFAINYLHHLLKKYGDLFPRKTRLKQIEELDVREIGKKKVKVGYDSETGYLGLKVSGPQSLECLNLDKLLIFYSDGNFSVINIPEKQYIHTKDGHPVWIGPADKTTPIQVLYKEEKTHRIYAKKFIVKQFILEKTYSYLKPGQRLEFLSSHPFLQLELLWKGKGKGKTLTTLFDFSGVEIKSVTANGVKISNQELQKARIVEDSNG